VRDLKTAVTRNAPMLPRPFQVRSCRKETYDTFTLEMKPANGKRTFSFQPGQFNMLYVPGVGEVPISISGDPDQPEKLVHTIRAVGAVTQALCRLKTGSLIGVRGPFGSGWPVQKAEGGDIVVVTGGIGLAPLRPALHALFHHRERFGRILILYGARTPDDILYRKQLETWRSRPDLEIGITVDRADDGWKGRVGVVTTLFSGVQLDPARTLALLCGPEIMMRFTAVELKRLNLNMDRVYISMERNMKCAIGQCGHCQYGPVFICKDGPIFPYTKVQHLLGVREV